MADNDLTARVRRAVRLIVTVAACGSLLAIPAWLVSSPFLAPPLGASIYVCVRARGMPAAVPRRVATSHLAGIACGLLARFALGVDARGLVQCQHSAPAFAAGVLALVLTAIALELADAVHPPAAATTLVVAFGIVADWLPLAALGAAGVLLAVAVAAFDRVVAKKPAGGA